MTVYVCPWGQRISFVEDDLPMFKFHIKLNEHQAKTETGFVEEILVG